jgi:undecaprenyl pyrophosphate synthase
MSLSKIANNHKRKLVSDDGSIEEPWNKKQRQQLGLPALFQIFEGKMPRLGDEDEKSMDVAINIYGTAEEPIFLAADVGKICDLAERSTRDKCESYEGTFLYVM